MLLEQFPFWEEKRYTYQGICRAFAHRSAHDSDSGSWNSCGDMKNGANTEWFGLYKDLHKYKERSPGYWVAPPLYKGTLPEDTWDILLQSVKDCSVEHPDAASVWAGKTQGEESHIYLLAIGCLICHRFPEAAHIWGDISAGQCRRATRWANQYLKQPIDVPVTADMKRLLPRLLKAGLPEEELLPAFYELTLQTKNRTMGAYLQEMLPEKVVYDYYRESLYQSCEDEVELRWGIVKEYLELGLDFRMLCRIVMADLESRRLQPQEFLRKILSMKLHIKEKETHDDTKLSKEQGDCEEVDYIDTVLGRVFGRMFGAGNKNVDAYLPLEQIYADVREVLGNSCDAEGIAEEILLELAEEDKKESLQNLLYDDQESIEKRVENYRKRKEECSRYDISSSEELINFQEGNSVLPKLHESLVSVFKKLHTFGEDAIEQFALMNRDEREYWFMRHYSVLITKELQDMIFDGIMDDAFIKRYAALYLVKCENIEIHQLIRAFLWNPELMNYYWELTESEYDEME